MGLGLISKLRTDAPSLRSNVNKHQFQGYLAPLKQICAFQFNWPVSFYKFDNNVNKSTLGYSIAVITFYLLRPLKLTNQNQSQIQSVQLLRTFAT
jgi:hypothetical protein